MAHTFDIRFDRATGLAALLQAPSNRFGWKGGGRLSIDAQGLEVAASRRRSQRIPAADIREVYREGDALRLEFAAGNEARSVLPFWARDRDTAARIVELLPTTRTVEVEEASPARPEAASSWRRPAAFGAIAAAMVLAAIYLAPGESMPASTATIAVDDRTPGYELPTLPADAPPVAEVPAQRPQDSVAEAAPTTVRTAQATEATLHQPAILPTADTPVLHDAVQADTPARTTNTTQGAATPAVSAVAEPEVDGFVPYVPAIRVSQAEQVVPIPRGTIAHDVGSRIMRRFEGLVAELNASYRIERQRFDSLSIDAAQFATRLESLAIRWRDRTVEALDGKGAQDPALTGLRASLIAAGDYQNAFLTGYAAGLRAGDSDAITKAFDELTRAEEMLERARLFLR